MPSSTVLVTGAAGFIGHYVAKVLLARGEHVVGVDNLNPYYSVDLKRARVAKLAPHPSFRFIEMDLADRARTADLFATMKFGRVVHLAAQAGVRYSLENPHAYVDANIVAFVNVLEGARHAESTHMVYASSSSVYGANTQMPFSTRDPVDHPVSLYAATKKANELMAHTYAHLFGLPLTGLRFFTVYGPWGRPDMALFKFTKAILSGEPIDVYNRGDMRRDFTFVDDIVEGVVRVLDRVPTPDASWNSDKPNPSTSRAPYRLYNIGNHSPVGLLEMIATLEKCLGVTAKRNLLPMQPGDVPATYADVDDLVADIGFQPRTSLDAGIAKFVEWYRGYYAGA